MLGDVSVRELRNHTAEVLRRVETGERLRVTVDRRPVAELAPLPGRETWVPRRRVLEALVQADAALADELADALPDEAAVSVVTLAELELGVHMAEKP